MDSKSSWFEFKDLRKLLLSILVISPCVLFVSYQSVVCIQKYFKHEIGTKLSFEDPAFHIFPSISICREGTELYASSDRFNPYLNKTHLEDCRFHGKDVLKSYYDDAKWSGRGNDNCTDPAKLYESIVTKPEDIINYIRYYFFNRSKTYTAKVTSKSKKTWSYSDHRRYGRCFTASPSEELIMSGIRKVRLSLFEKPVRLFFHTPGIFLTNLQPTFVSVEKRRQNEIDFKHEEFKMLEIRGNDCIKDKSFNRDACTQRSLEARLLKEVGCTTPYELNKTKICSNQGDRNKSLAMHKETYESTKNNKFCLHPCNFITARAIINSNKIGYFVDGKPGTTVTIKFKENIKVYEAYQIYSLLSMIAEIGGYVGMFLGISILQIRFVLDKLLSWIDELWQHLKRRIS